MHERSIVLSLIEQVDDELSSRGLVDLREVRVSIGEFAGIEPQLLISAFEELATQHWGLEVHLNLDVVSLTACCERCGCMFPVVGFRFVCPDCQSGLVQVIHGEEMRLVSLTAAHKAPTGTIA